MFSSSLTTRPMITCLSALCSLWMLPASCLPDQADATADVQQTLQAMYDTQNAAILRHDIDSTMVPYASDALFLDETKGSQSVSLAGVRKGWLDLFQAPTEKMTGVSRRIDKTTLSKTHQAATLLTVLQIRLSVTARSGKVVPVEVEEHTQFYWVKGDHGWRIEQQRITSIDTFRDEKLVRHNRKPVAS